MKERGNGQRVFVQGHIFFLNPLLI